MLPLLARCSLLEFRRAISSTACQTKRYNPIGLPQCSSGFYSLPWPAHAAASPELVQVRNSTTGECMSVKTLVVRSSEDTGSEGLSPQSCVKKDRKGRGIRYNMFSLFVIQVTVVMQLWRAYFFQYYFSRFSSQCLLFVMIHYSSLIISFSEVAGAQKVQKRFHGHDL